MKNETYKLPSKYKKTVIILSILPPVISVVFAFLLPYALLALIKVTGIVNIGYENISFAFMIDMLDQYISMPWISKLTISLPFFAYGITKAIYVREQTENKLSKLAEEIEKNIKKDLTPEELLEIKTAMGTDTPPQTKTYQETRVRCINIANNTKSEHFKHSLKAFKNAGIIMAIGTLLSANLALSAIMLFIGGITMLTHPITDLSNLNEIDKFLKAYDRSL